jgi:hypothetical protein
MPLAVRLDHTREAQVVERVDISAAVCLNEESSAPDGTLTLKITAEGVILDATNDESGDVVRTGYLLWDDLLDLTK